MSKQLTVFQETNMFWFSESYGLNIAKIQSFCVVVKKVMQYCSRERVGGVEIWIHAFLNHALIQFEQVAWHTSRRTAGQKKHRFLLCGRLGGPQLWSGGFGKEISRFLLSVVQPRLVGFQRLAWRYTDWAIPTPFV
jgi:hypothetical protein